MQKIMSYIEKPVDYTRRLRYLLVNIIEMIPELRELNIEYIINNKAEFKSWFEYYGTSSSFMCGVELNQGELILNNTTFRTTLFVIDLYKYLSIYNINLSDENEQLVAIWIFVTLHELGHIKYYNRFKNKYTMIEPLNDDYNNGISSVLNSNNIESMESYFMRPSELYADQFAYRYFPYVWNNLKSMNLI